MGGLDRIVHVHPDGIRVTVRARPSASRRRDAALVDVGEGKQAVEISVAAQATDGKANKAVLEEMARLFGVRKTDVTLKTGHTSRLKVIGITGDATALLRKAETLFLEK